MSDLAWDISRKIEDSSWGSDTKALTQKYVQEAQNIKASFKAHYWEDSKTYKALEKEYQDLTLSIETALEDNKISTVVELEDIRKQFEDIKIHEKKIDIQDNMLKIDEKTFDIQNTSWDEIEDEAYKQILNNKEAQESIEKEKIMLERVGMIQTILPMWITTAQEVLNSMVWKSRRKDDDIIQANISVLTGKSVEIESLLIEENYDKIDIVMKEIFQIMEDTEKEESIFNDNIEFVGKSDLETIKDLFYQKWDKDTKMLKIYNIVRAWALKWIWMSSWNSEWVKEAVSNHILEEKWFEYIQNILSDQKIYEEIQKAAENNSDNIQVPSYIKKKLGEKFWEDFWEKLGEKLIKIYTANFEYIEKRNISPEIQYQLRVATWNEVQRQMKHTLIRKHIADMEVRGNHEKSYIWLYADLTGLWEEKWIHDSLSVSDSNAATITRFAVDVWTMLIPLAGWLKAATWAYRGMKFSIKGRRMNIPWVQKLFYSIPKVGKYFKTWKKFKIKESISKVWYTQTIKALGIHSVKELPERILRSAVKWLAFNEVHNLITSTMFGRNLKENSVFWEKWWEKFYKSAAFFFFVRYGYQAVDRIMKSMPPNILQSIIQTVLQGATITQVWIMIEKASGNEHKWTPEEFLKVISIILIFKGMHGIWGSKSKSKQKDTDAKQKDTSVKEWTSKKVYENEKQRTQEDKKENYFMSLIYHDTSPLSLNEKVQLKNQLETDAQTHKNNIQNIVGKRLEILYEKHTQKEVELILKTFMSNIIQTFSLKEQEAYIKAFEEQYGIQFSKEEKENIFENLSQYRIIQDKIKKLEEEIQRELKSYIRQTWKKNGRYYILTQDGHFLEDLSEQEWRNVQQPWKETFIENSAYFQKTLKETGMFELWKIKEEIVTSIWRQNMQIDSKKFLKENQIKIFFSEVLTSIWENPPSDSLPIWEFIIRIKKMNGGQVWESVAEVNNRWDSKFMKKFREEFYPPNGTFINFKTEDFSNAIKK